MNFWVEEFKMIPAVRYINIWQIIYFFLFFYRQPCWQQASRGIMFSGSPLIHLSHSLDGHI